MRPTVFRLATLGALAAAGLVLIPRPSPAQVQRPDLGPAGWARYCEKVATVMGSKKPHVVPKALLVGPAARAPRPPVGIIYELVAVNLLLLDVDLSGTVTVGDTLTAEGLLENVATGQTVGIFELNSTLTWEGDVGLCQIGFPNQGTMVIGGGTSYSDGVRAGIPCRALVGGTGKFATKNGNAGFFSTDEGGLFVSIGTK